MNGGEYPEIDEFLANAMARVKAKRPRAVLEHIARYGFITTEELTNLYGYAHPPRAARDVREAGIPLITERVVDAKGRSIARYRLGDPRKILVGRAEGRMALPLPLKKILFELQAGRCAACGGTFPLRYFQADHRVPYEVAGDVFSMPIDPEHFMLLCGACNRSKSWSCEHCQNWLGPKDSAACRECYWSGPHDRQYTHVALKPARRLDLNWSGPEVAVFEQLMRLAEDSGTDVGDFVKDLLAKATSGT